MSQSKNVGVTAGAIAALPLTGANVAMMVLGSIVIIIVGLLLMRATARRGQS